MTDLTPYVIGANASCTDGACGQVSRVIIDAATTTVTHLVIEPEDKHQPDRLVPLDLLAQRERSLAPLLGSGVLPARQRRKEAVLYGEPATRRQEHRRPDQRSQAGACPDRTRAIPCTVRAVTGQVFRGESRPSHHTQKLVTTRATVTDQLPVTWDAGCPWPTILLRRAPRRSAQRRAPARVV